MSEDLKYALREAIELLGNEAARQLRQQAADSKKSVFSGKYELDASELSLECLRLVYRLLFMFYIEARPELGYVPIAKSEVYLKGYSLESLRDLEHAPLNTAACARRPLFRCRRCAGCSALVAQGCGAARPGTAGTAAGVQGRLRAGAARQPPVRLPAHAAAEQGAVPQPRLADASSA